MFMHKPSEDVENTHTAVIVCPGGSYHHLGLKGEGNTTATWFAENGVTAFVLKYRTAESFYHHPAMLQDIQRAIQLVRENAEEWDIDPEKVGIIGFSAGGHLVTMAGEFWQTHDEIAKLGIECQVSLRPDFVIPVYPVVSMEKPYAHRWSRLSLIGRSADQETKHTFSMENQIKGDMCPVFLLACKDDPTVDYRNSVDLDQALTEAGVEHVFILLETGGHGFGMNYGWGDTLYSWLKKLYH